LIKSYSKDIYNVKKDSNLNKCCSFELSIHHRIMGGNGTLLFSTLKIIIYVF